MFCIFVPDSIQMGTQKGKILIIGGGGQVGSDLAPALRAMYGKNEVIATDVRSIPGLSDEGPFEVLDCMDKKGLHQIIQDYNVKTIYHLAAVLSAKGEENPMFAWQLNMESLFHVLDAAKDLSLDRVFWPSSIAAFGPTTPKQNTPQDCIMDPTTIYGISKLAGERWCEWYFKKYGVDVRSLRYPGLIGWKALPGGGTTDYAVEVFHKAFLEKKYTSFLSEGTMLPMMYMPDAIKATIEIMEAPKEKIKIRSSYNLAGCSFTPLEVANEIKKHIPEFEMYYKSDFRQGIADSWPQSIQDNNARTDWGWKPSYELPEMTIDMLENIAKHHIRKEGVS